MTHSPEFSIALVGPEFEENLSLRYLAGTLSARGYDNIKIVPYNSVHDARRIAEQLAAEGPDLVGLSMAFQSRAIEDMLLCELLRKRGYGGHITAGGQFVTLHYRDVLDDCPGLDSVVMFEGEHSLAALAQALQFDGALSQVSSLAWRSPGAAGPITVNTCTPAPTPVDELAFPLRSPGAQRYLGLAKAHMVGSRGCHASCKYCCVAALTSDRRQAAQVAGSGDFLPGTRRRCPHNVAQEVAQLYHKHEVRIFEFQDDNWVPPVPAKAIDYFRTFRNDLDTLGVGQIGITLKMRADAVTPDIIRTLKDIGLIRAFVGIESGSQSLLSKLGRTMRESVSERALGVLRAFQVPAYFNALLFGPDLSFDEIEPELAFLADHGDFPFEIVEVVIYGRTGLYKSLKQQNRLTGNYLAYDYQYADARLRDVYDVVAALRTRHFGVYSPIKMAADLGFNLGILRVFYPGRDTDVVGQEVEQITRRINQDQLGAIREAVRYAESDFPTSVAADLLGQETATTDLGFYRKILSIQNRMERLVAARLETARPHIRSYFRGGLVASGLVAGLLSLAADNTGAAEPEGPAESLEQAPDDGRRQHGLTDAERRQATKLIRELDSDQFAIRERATRKLIEMAVQRFHEKTTGLESLLEQATSSESAEVRSRTRQILLRMWLHSLRSADADQRQFALDRLAKSQTSIRPIIAGIVGKYLMDMNGGPDDVALMSALRTVLQKRQAEDVERLRDVITKSVPKLHIATGLMLKVDKQGNVIGVSAHDGPLEEETEQTILKLLAGRQFKVHEVTGRVRVPADARKALEVLDFDDPTEPYFQQFRLRQGPLD